MIRKEGGFFFQLCEGGSAVVTLVMMTMRIMRGNKKDADDKEVLHWLYMFVCIATLHLQLLHPKWSQRTTTNGQASTIAYNRTCNVKYGT